MSYITRIGFALLLLLFPREQLGKLRSAIQTKQSDAGDRHASKDDCRKRKRHDAIRSQPVERNQFRWQDQPHLQFAVAANSFFTILVFNDQLRGPEPGSMALVPQANALRPLPVSLSRISQAARRRKTSFGRERSISPCATARPDSPFLISKDISTITTPMRSCSASPAAAANLEGVCQRAWPPVRRRPVAGEISIGATMQPIEINQLDENGNVKSASLPALNQPGVGTVPGPDVIVGELLGLVQLRQWCSQWPRRPRFGN